MKTTQQYLSRQAAVRLQAGELILREFDNDEIIDILGVSLSSLKTWRRLIKNGGIQALARKPGSSCPSKLTSEQLNELKTIIGQDAREHGYLTDRWTSRIVADLIRKKWNVEYCRSNVRKILVNLRLSYKKPEVKSTKHSQAVVDHWRQHDWERIKKKRTRAVGP